MFTWTEKSAGKYVCRAQGKKTVIDASCKAREKVRLVASAARENI